MLPPKPPDFDWVSVRHGCTIAQMFVTLKRLAKRDVDRFNELAGESLVTVNDGYDASIFAVTRPRFGEKLTVVFSESNEGITIRTLERGEWFLTLTMTDDAECKLKMGSDVLDPWQVLRRALESVLFSPNR